MREGGVPLEDLAYQVKLHFDLPEKSMKNEALHQPYQCAVQLLNSGRKVNRGSTVSFVKVKPFFYGGKKFTVKPIDLVKDTQEINVEDYVKNLRTALSQIFKPMNLSFEEGKRTTLADFI